MVSFIAGTSAPPVDAWVTLVHCQRRKGKGSDRIPALKDAGVTVVDSPSQMGVAMQKAMLAANK